MFLKSLRLFNVRCYDEVSIEPHHKFNVIRGLNGQGKTTLLEAIGLLTSLKSFRGAKSSEIIRLGAEKGLISGNVERDDLRYTLDVKLGLKRKQGMFNGKFCKYLSEYVGKTSAVSFNPNDLEIIRGAPENRRNWMDKITSILFPEHVDVVAQYQKVVTQRNRLLKSYADGKISSLPGDFEVWTEKLCDLGAKIIHKRINTVDKIGNLLQSHLNEITQQNQSVNIRYFSKIFAEDRYRQERIEALEVITQTLKENLIRLQPKELILGSTLVGPHRDDLEIFLDENSLKVFGSQGEVRSLVLAMRMTEVDLWKEVHQVDPLLLIDDFSSELDERRRNFLLEFLTDSKSQVFLSTTEKLEKGAVFEVSEGKVHLNSNGYV